MGQNRPKFRVLSADKHTGLKKGPPPPVVANMSHADIIPSGTLKTTSTFESQPLLWVAGRKGPIQSGPDGRSLKFVLTFFKMDFRCPGNMHFTKNWVYYIEIRFFSSWWCCPADRGHTPCLGEMTQAVIKVVCQHLPTMDMARKEAAQKTPQITFLAV